MKANKNPINFEQFSILFLHVNNRGVKKVINLNGNNWALDKRIGISNRAVKPAFIYSKLDGGTDDLRTHSGAYNDDFIMDRIGIMQR